MSKARDDHSKRFFLFRPLWLRGLRRRNRWLFRIVIAGPLLFVVACVVLFRSPLTRVLVLPQIEKALNLKVEADSVYVNGSGEMVLNGASFVLPGVPGPAGKFLRVGRVTADLDWLSTLTGSPRFRSIQMVEPVLTVSQNIGDRKLNLGALDLPKSSSKTAIPAITVVNAGIELGEHRGTFYRPLKHIVMNGRFAPAPGDASGAYEFVLQESSTRVRTPGGQPEPGIRIAGRLGADDSIGGSIENFYLSDWPAQSLPAPVREVFAQLDLTGDVPRSTFSYTEKDGMRAQLELHGVGMNIPVPQDTGDPRLPPLVGPPAFALRMHGVNGTILFAKDSVLVTVEGLIEDMPYKVRLAYRGTDPSSAFTCDFETTNFRVERNPVLLPYAPPRVTEYLRLFSSPTALLSTKVTVARGAPVNGEPGEITFGGTVELSEGTAAFERFPYPFKNMRGLFRFDSERVEIVRVTGESESGARLVATGLVEPLDDTAEVTINVDVTGAPIDDRIEEAFGPDHGQVLRALFNEEKYEELLETGLIRSPAQETQEQRDLQVLTGALPRQSGPDAEAARAEIARLTSRQKIPVFAFRGDVNVSVRAHSPRGRNTDWDTTIDVELPRAGMVAEKFPYPIIGEGVKIHILNTEGKIVAGTFHALGGGTAQVGAGFIVAERAWTDQDSHPEIRVLAHELPVDEMLIHALPGPDTGTEGHGIKALLRRMKLSGAGDADVHIADRADQPGKPTGFDADVHIAGARADPAPRPGAPALSITDIGGTIKASEDALNVDLSGQARLASPPAGRPSEVGGALAVRAHADFVGNGPAGWTDFTVNVSCPQVPLDSPVESLVGVFSDPGARRIEELRSARRPTGVIDTNVRVAAEKGAAPRVDIELSGPRSVGLAVLGGRLELPWALGKATVSPDDGLVRFSGFEAPISFEKGTCGELFLDGPYAIGEPDIGNAPADRGHPLSVSLHEARFESPLIYRILENRVGRDEALTYGGYRPHGRFDAEFQVPSGDAPGQGGSMRGRIVPTVLSATFDGRPVLFEKFSGAVEIEPGGGKLDGVTASTRDWTVGADGGWTRGGGGDAYQVHTQLSLRGRSLTEDLRAVLPPELRDIFRQIQLESAGPLSMEGATLSVGRQSEDAGRTVKFDGTVQFEGASLDAGLPIRNMTGRAHATVNRESGDRPPEYRVQVDADTFNIAGVYLRDGKAIVRSGTQAGEILIEGVAGECYGGRFAANARLSPSSSRDSEAPRRLDAQVKIAGTRFAPFVESLNAGPGSEGPPIPEEAAEADFSRGVLDAELTLTGLLGKPESRRGRGSMRISGGRIVSLPLVIRLVEASNLQIPSNSRLDFARASFYVEGGLVNFTDAAAFSTAVEIVGTGTMTWPGQVLDFRFNSRAARPIPLISRVIQGIRDELLTTSVTGLLSEPVVSLQQFPGARRMLGRAVGSPDSSSERAADLEHRAEAAEARALRRGVGIPARPVQSQVAGQAEEPPAPPSSKEPN